MARTGLGRTGMALALAAGFGLAAGAQAQMSTQTTLAAETREVGGRTVANFTATVLSEDGLPATGAVTIVERGRDVAGAALDAEGKAQVRLDSLSAGDHALRVVYSGDALHLASKSGNLVLHPLVTGTPDFGLAIAPASLSLKAGTAGVTVTTITPSNGFTGFLSLSCSGLPVGVTCTYTPANLQVTGTALTAVADLSIQTTGPAGKSSGKLEDGKQSTLVLAVLLPGIVGLGFLGRKRKLFRGLTMLTLVGVLGVLGATGCAARYKYFHHPPTYNGGTPLGSYTITVTAQTSNGVTATEHTVPLALTVN